MRFISVFVDCVYLKTSSIRSSKQKFLGELDLLEILKSTLFAFG